MVIELIHKKTEVRKNSQVIHARTVTSFITLSGTAKLPFSVSARAGKITTTKVSLMGLEHYTHQDSCQDAISVHEIKTSVNFTSRRRTLAPDDTETV
ncbi:hypothetical protein J6590_029329 [Homalodisca vitripennis]|nr:hypothetical protein J6590_029329 [Homalodisca vitripennis]